MLIRTKVCDSDINASIRMMKRRRMMLMLLLLTEEYQKHFPAPKQQGTEGRTGHRIASKNA